MSQHDHIGAITEALKDAAEFWESTDDGGCWIEGYTPDLSERAFRAVAFKLQAEVLRDFADNHVHAQTPARMAEDMHAYADELEGKA